MTARPFGGALSNAVLARVGRAVSRLQEEASLPVDVLESDDEYLVVFDAPGVDPNEVHVTCDERAVRVRVERFRESHEGFDLRLPGRGRSLHGHATLPRDAVVDEERARATLRENGTLHVFLPKSGGDPGDD